MMSSPSSSSIDSMSSTTHNLTGHENHAAPSSTSHLEMRRQISSGPTIALTGVTGSSATNIAMNLGPSGSSSDSDYLPESEIYYGLGVLTGVRVADIPALCQNMNGSVVGHHSSYLPTQDQVHITTQQQQQNYSNTHASSIAMSSTGSISSSMMMTSQEPPRPNNNPPLSSSTMDEIENRSKPGLASTSRSTIGYLLQ